MALALRNCVLRATTSSTILGSARMLRMTPSVSALKIVESHPDDKTTLVEVVEHHEKEPNRPVWKVEPGKCSLCVCNLPTTISYEDVLILEQFMREDGTVLPGAVTGLCPRQQRRIERLIMQAHWSGLFPDRTIPDFDRSGYKRFNRHWDDDKAAYKLKLKTLPGTWYYIKRYPTKNAYVPQERR